MRETHRPDLNFLLNQETTLNPTCLWECSSSFLQHFELSILEAIQSKLHLGQFTLDQDQHHIASAQVLFWAMFTLPGRSDSNLIFPLNMTEI